MPSARSVLLSVFEKSCKSSSARDFIDCASTRIFIRPGRQHVAAFAGSRHGSVSQETAHALISGFTSQNFSFLVGCAPGVDQSFRKALAAAQPPVHCTVHGAFPFRVRAVKKERLLAGRSSCLAFKTAVQQRKKIFVITAIPPLSTRRTRVSRVSLFGVLSGYLVEPAAKEVTHAA